MPKSATQSKAASPYARPAAPKVIAKPGKIPVKVDHLITEDDTPVDNLFSEKQQRLLTEPLYSSWHPVKPNGKRKPRKYLAAANVSVFCHNKTPRAAIVPDVFISMDVAPAKNWHAKEHRSYFIWEFGKAPELVIEVVSNRKGGELTTKPKKYARCGISYYVVFDPTHALGQQTLRLYELHAGAYVQRTHKWFPQLGLGLTLWQGEYEDINETWLRWCDEDGKIIPTGAERADEQAARADALAEKIRALGIDPDQL